MDTKFHYWLDASRNTQASFIAWIVALLVWGSGIPLAFGALGSGSDVAVGLTVVSAATTVFHFILGASTVDQYKKVTADTPDEARDTNFAQSELKSPFGFFSVITAAATISVFVGHLLVLGILF